MTKNQKTPSDQDVKTQHHSRPRIRDFVDTVIEIAQAKGWNAELETVDEQKHRFATVYVSKDFGGSVGDVVALLELTCDKDIKLSVEKSSFYDKGLRDLRDAIWSEIESLPWVAKKIPESGAPSDISIAESVLRRFNRSIRQFKHRYNNRDPFLISDEYDVQDFLHVILRAYFDDIRTEEYCPSYAGGSSRIDFLLKKSSIAIEVKFASARLKDRHVGEQLIIDIERYKNHPGCKSLFCFVYDPDGFIQNPAGLETDLTQKTDNLNVKVVVLSPA